MPNAKHTPGPWTWALYYSGLFGPTMEPVLDYEANEGMGLYGHYAGGKAEAKARANARLISAAPDMYEALRSHDAYMSKHYSGPDSDALHPDAARNWRTVRAAIAKAGKE